MERLTERAEIDKCPGIWVKEGFVNDGTKTWFNACDEGYSAISKCAEYEDLEEQGKLLKLPCAVGDTVYAFNMSKIIELKVIEISWFTIDRKNIINVKCLNTKCDCLRNFIFEEFGKTVFLTREEAEATLKELSAK